MTACPVCDSGTFLEIETRDAVPIAQNLVFHSREEAIHCPAGALAILRCTGCSFAWNDAFDPELLDYDTAYDNDQNFSPRFRQHTDTIADIIVDNAPANEPVRLMEVGCGQGKFLHILAEKLGDRLEVAKGFDPAWKGDAERLPPRCEVRGEYFDRDSLAGDDPPPNLVVSRHVIEHVADPLAFLSAIREPLPPGTPVLIETPDVDWILRNGVFFDFYYEHCSLFTPHSLRVALQRAGFEVGELRTVFEDQYMLAAATAGTWSEHPQPVGEFGDLGYREKRDRFLQSLARVIDAKRRHGGLALWGGASKGVTICLTLPDAARRIDCVIDINERKQGCFLPTSGMQVVGPGEAWDRGVRSAIVVNPAYMGEIAEFCSNHGLAFDLVPIDVAGTDVEFELKAGQS